MFTSLEEAIYEIEFDGFHNDFHILSYPVVLQVLMVKSSKKFAFSSS